MKKTLFILLLFVYGLSIGQTTHIGDRVVFHLSPGNYSSNNDQVWCPFFQASEIHGTDSIEGWMMAYPTGIWHNGYYVNLRHCVNQADMEDPGECWTTMAESALWGRPTEIPANFSGDYDDLTDKPTLNISNWNTAFGWGNHASAGYDPNTTNEIQDLSRSSNTLSLSGDATTVDLSLYLDNTDAQTLSFTSPNLSISSGNSVDLSALVSGKQNQLNGTGFVKASGTTISYDNSTYITGNQTITLSGDVTGSGTTAITTTLANSGVTAGTYGVLTVDAKGRATSGKRQETYSGTTNGSGVYSVTFGTSYSVAPNIQANIVGGSSNQVITMTVSTTGFTCTVVQRNSVTLLATEVLLANTTNVSGANVDVLITEK